MPQYLIHVYCNECGQPHSMGIGITLDDPTFDQKSIGDIYAGRELPPQVMMVKNNYVSCPTTGKLTAQKDNDQIFLVATGR